MTSPSISAFAPFGTQLQNLSAPMSTQGSFFIYNLDTLVAHAKRLKQSGLNLWYACKANPLSAVLTALDTADFNFDVASYGELQQVIKCHIPGKRILLTGPAKSEAFLRLALQYGVETFVIESATQLSLLETLAQEYDYTPAVLLRLQLQWDRTAHSVLGGSQITPFGMDLATAEQVLQRLKLPFLGFHVFQWGNMLQADDLAAIWRETIVCCKRLAPSFEVLDVGGGLGIPYADESSLEWDDVVAKITDLQTHYAIPSLWLELGRYITGPHGLYMTKVVDKKTTYGKQILVLEGGINHIARPALTNQPFPVTLLRDSHAPLEEFALHGPLCTALDHLGTHLLPADITVHDTLLFGQTGAYGFTESMPYFLCHTLPGEAVIENGTLRVIRPPAEAHEWMK